MLAPSASAARPPSAEATFVALGLLQTHIEKRNPALFTSPRASARGAATTLPATTAWRRSTAGTPVANGRGDQSDGSARAGAVGGGHGSSSVLATLLAGAEARCTGAVQAQPGAASTQMLLVALADLLAACPDAICYPDSLETKRRHVSINSVRSCCCDVYVCTLMPELRSFGKN